jgi:serine/threonine protein kinase
MSSSIGAYRIQRRIAGEEESYSCVGPAGEPRVLRLFRGGAAGWQQARDEVLICASLDHPALLAPLDVFEHQGRLALVYPELDGAPLRELLAHVRRARKSFELAAAWAVSHAVAGVLATAHDASDHDGLFITLCHGHLSPSQVWIEADGRVRLRGLGLASLVGSRGASAEPGFQSPEERAGRAITPRGDVYSLAALVWSMLAGRNPPTDNRMRPAALRRDLPRSLESLLARALEPDLAKRRITAAELESAFAGASEISAGQGALAGMVAAWRKGSTRVGPGQVEQAPMAAADPKAAEIKAAPRSLPRPFDTAKVSGSAAERRGVSTRLGNPTPEYAGPAATAEAARVGAATNDLSALRSSFDIDPIEVQPSPDSLPLDQLEWGDDRDPLGLDGIEVQPSPDSLPVDSLDWADDASARRPPGSTNLGMGPDDEPSGGTAMGLGQSGLAESGLGPSGLGGIDDLGIDYGPTTSRGVGARPPAPKPGSDTSLGLGAHRGERRRRSGTLGGIGQPTDLAAVGRAIESGRRRGSGTLGGFEPVPQDARHDPALASASKTIGGIGEPVKAKGFVDAVRSGQTLVGGEHPLAPRAADRAEPEDAGAPAGGDAAFEPPPATDRMAVDGGAAESSEFEPAPTTTRMVDDEGSPSFELDLDGAPERPRIEAGPRPLAAATASSSPWQRDAPPDEKPLSLLAALGIALGTALVVMVAGVWWVQRARTLDDVEPPAAASAAPTASASASASTAITKGKRSVAKKRRNRGASARLADAAKSAKGKAPPPALGVARGDGSKLEATKGYARVIYEGNPDAELFYFGRPVGKAAGRHVVDCQRNVFLRIGVRETGTKWLTEGKTVKVACQSVTDVRF